MTEDSIYEFYVNRSDNAGEVVLSKLVKRLVKVSPTNSDVIRKAFICVSTNIDLSMLSYSFTSISFALRALEWMVVDMNSVTSIELLFPGACRGSVLY